jgi:nucleoside-diphosphate-sugar epimerase
VKLLVLGGTQFVGRAVVEAALERGDEVTLFNRGETNPELFPEAEKVRGDRAVDPIPPGRWDAVVDTCGYIPAVVRRSAEALRDSVECYLFVSSISAYASFSGGPTEDSPRAELGDMPIDEMLPGYENYGPLKALCEDVVTEVYGERALIVRPGLIVGPHDPTGRFTYWPHRVARGGEFIVPAAADGQVQFVDARDLGAWLVDLCRRRESSSSSRACGSPAPTRDRSGLTGSGSPSRAWASGWSCRCGCMARTRPACSEPTSRERSQRG